MPQKKTHKDGDPLAPEGVPVRVEVPKYITPLPSPPPVPPPPSGLQSLVSQYAQQAQPPSPQITGLRPLVARQSGGFHFDRQRQFPQPVADEQQYAVLGSERVPVNSDQAKLVSEYERYLRENGVTDDERNQIIKDIVLNKQQ